MASPELTVEVAYGLLASWSATLTAMARSRRSVADLRAVLEEIVPALRCLDDAIRREREALALFEAATQDCFCCGEPTRCEQGICEQCQRDLTEIVRTYWLPRMQREEARKRPWERL